ncbi:MAG: MBL fold metallo-hydrolase [Cyanobacteria bacterium P01_D01_bin.73]
MSSQSGQFLVRFWGVRGRVPCPGDETVRYGGNTPCLEMQIGEQRLVFDGGTGLRVLGQAMLREMPIEAHLFFSHAHWDHTQGFPFFVPAFVRGNRFHIYGAPSLNGITIEKRLHDQMLHPNFPVPLQVMGADLQFHNLRAAETIQIGDVVVENDRLHHPGEALGYRISWNGCCVAYVTDIKGRPCNLDEQILRVARDADVLIYDATYTCDKYEEKVGCDNEWSHDSWQEGVKIAQAAGVGQLIIFHHDPTHTDVFLDEMGDRLEKELPGSVVAMEGMVVEVFPPSPKGKPKEVNVTMLA